MQNKHDWYESIPMLQPEEDPARTQRIQKRVMQQLPHTAEREMCMQKKSVLRRIRPLICVAAVIAIGAVSLVTVNAATDGALFTKVTMYINGKETDFDARIVDEDNNTITYEFVKDDGNSNDNDQNDKLFAYTEKDAIGAECEGNPGDDIVIEFEAQDSSAEPTEKGTK